MKKLLPLLLATSLLLSACSIDWNDEKNKKITELEKQNIELKEKNSDSGFQKKQECLSLVSELKAKTNQLGIEYSSLGKFGFEQVFFSPKYNNCLWVRTIEVKKNDYQILTKSLYEVGNDSGTSESIDNCSRAFSYIDENLTPYTCDQFDKKIQELKGE